MKKTYIEPYCKVHKVHPIQVIAESFSMENKTDSGKDLDGSSSGEQDNSVWSREDGGNNGGNIWDNAW